MTNAEKYREEIENYSSYKFCEDFVKPKILKVADCEMTDCIKCGLHQLLWLMDEYKDPEVDWSKVAVDTPILVRNDDYATTSWLRRYFAEYDDGVVYAWNCGCTSWSETVMNPWNYAKLAESEEE